MGDKQLQLETARKKSRIRGIRLLQTSTKVDRTTGEEVNRTPFESVAES